MHQTLNAQEGGKVALRDKTSGGADPVINDPPGTIDMTITLVDDITLPSYLVPKLTDNAGIALSNGSKVKVTLSGANLEKKTPPKDFKCEITSNFLNEKDKSAITIETYYPVSGSSPAAFITNIIYFDESLLRSYTEDKNQLTYSKNPFSVDVDATSSTDGTYTFNFNFDTIIRNIKLLPSYKQIQNMFMFVNGIDSSSSTPTSECLLKISAGAFLNLKFKGVPFTSTFVEKGPKLTIETIQPPDSETTNKSFTSLPNAILKDKLKQVLDLASYEFNCANLVPKAGAATQSLSQSAIHPNPQPARDEDIKDYEYALRGYQTACASGDPQKIRHAEAALATALKKPGIDQYLTSKKASVTAGSPGKTEIDRTYDAKIKISNNNILNADHNAEFTSIKNNLENENVRKHFGLSTIASSSTSISQQSSINPTQPLTQIATPSNNRRDSPLTLIGVPGDNGSCGSGGISLMSDGKVVTIGVPVDTILAEIMTPVMIAKLKASGGGGESEDKVTPIVVQPNAVRLTTPIIPSPLVVVVDEATKTELQKAKDDLAAANLKFKDVKDKLTGLSLSSSSSNSIDAPTLTNAIDAIKTTATSAIAAADTAVNTSSQDAKQKVAAATAEVLKATQAVQKFSDAVDAAAQIKPASVVAPQSAAAAAAATLDEADKNALAKAKTDLATEQKKLKDAGGLPVPNEVDALEGAIKPAEAAVAAFTIATEADKSTLLKDAKAKIASLAALVKAANTAVDAAIAAKPSTPEPDLSAYNKAYEDYDAAKKKYDGALVDAQRLQAAAVTTGASGASPIQQEIDAAKATFKEAIEGTSKLITNDDKTIVQMGDDTFNALNDARQEQIDNLMTATAAYSDALSKLKAAQAEYEKATRSGSSESSGKNAEDLAYDRATTDIEAAIGLIKPKISADSAASDAIATTEVDDAAKKAAESVNKFNNLLKPKPQQLTDAVAAIKGLGETIQKNSKYLELLTNLDTQLKENIPHTLPPAEDDHDLPPPPASFEEQLKKVIALIDTASNSVRNIIGLNVSSAYTSEQVLKATQDSKNAANAAEDSNFVEAAAAKAKADQTGSTGDAAAATDAITAAARAVNTDADKVNSKLQSDDKNGILDLIKELLEKLEKLKKLLPLPEAEPEEEEAGGFSLFDGGYKQPKSSSISKSSSKSKSKSKNKTKKNHSKSKSGKSKTPKIIMNE